ncbi:MAG: hypothetical protein DI582_10015 [Azospirillum brasilense]|nr:MAG: hypothetical protein DI582_10015 [Azospirillum brasilense]
MPMADCLQVIAHLPEELQAQARMLKQMPRADVLRILKQHTTIMVFRQTELHDGDIVLWRVHDDRYHISRYSAINDGFVTYGDQGWHVRPLKAVYDLRGPRPDFIVRV